MARNDPTERLGLSIPYDWWPAASLLKEIEAAGFRYVQVPSPPPSVLTVPRDAHRHAAALADVLGTSGLRVVLHGPQPTCPMLPPAKIGALRRPVRLRRSPRPPSASE